MPAWFVWLTVKPSMTRATLDSSGFSRLITQDSIISLYKSFPSRLRSPLPRRRRRRFCERADEVDYFDARFQHFRAGGLLVQRRSAAVNAFHAGAGERAAFVHGFTQHIEDAIIMKIRERVQAIIFTQILIFFII